jgi:hypothetical protein
MHNFARARCIAPIRSHSNGFHVLDWICLPLIPTKQSIVARHCRGNSICLCPPGRADKTFNPIRTPEMNASSTSVFAQIDFARVISDEQAWDQTERNLRR